MVEDVFLDQFSNNERFLLFFSQSQAAIHTVYVNVWNSHTSDIYRAQFRGFPVHSREVHNVSTK